MRKQIKTFAMTLGLASALVLPAAASAEEAAASSAISTASGLASGQVTAGFYWCKGSQAHRDLGSTITWLYLESCQSAGAAPVWIACNDNECEKLLIAAAASAHYIGINFNTASTFNWMRLYKF